MRWLALLMVAILLAGCSGKASGVNQVRLGDGSRISLDLDIEDQPDPEDIRGAVSGVVVNEAIYPVGEAQVRILGWNYNATTTSNGRFVFTAMPPGLYTIEVSKAEHANGLGTVNVKSGEVAKSVLMMPRLPYIAPYHRTILFDEYFSQADELAGRTRDHILAIDMVPATFILEAKWDPIVVATGNPLQYSMKPETRVGQPASTGTGANPLRVQFESDQFNANEYALRLDVQPVRLSAPAESKGRIAATAFYITPAPDGWSFVRGDQ